VFEARFDRVYPAPRTAPVFDLRADFVPGNSGNLKGFPRRNRAEPLFPGSIISTSRCATISFALISKSKWKTEGVMLSWVVTFLIIALIAGILGFGGLAGASIEIAKIIFFIAVVLFLVSAVVGLARGRTRV
jgi:uncharacterized membrane protein YtjA (UPF0391 family)